jgi:hypothetical protein
MDDEASTLAKRARRKAYFLYYYRWLGVTAVAAEFSAQIVQDVKERFYSDQLAWAWLGYEGPPFPLGYFGKPDNCHLPRS